ncbi:MAG: dihydrofolate reductase [Clostridiales bacterium]|nr:dihydrofolate reductase [Clostridiales bacterium]
MSISIIAATGKNNELGKNNDLIWHFHRDMVFFREITTGNTVAMGRKTYESLSKLLPNRKNVIITHNSNYKVDGAVMCRSIDEAVEKCKGDKMFVIGGASIYKEFLPLADEMYITEIDSVCSEADVYFPDFDKKQWKKEILAEYEENGIKFSHTCYTKK